MLIACEELHWPRLTALNYHEEESVAQTCGPLPLFPIFYLSQSAPCNGTAGPPWGTSNPDEASLLRLNNNYCKLKL